MGSPQNIPRKSLHQTRFSVPKNRYAIKLSSFENRITDESSRFGLENKKLSIFYLKKNMKGLKSKINGLIYEIKIHLCKFTQNVIHKYIFCIRFSYSFVNSQHLNEILISLLFFLNILNRKQFIIIISCNSFYLCVCVSIHRS